MVVTLKRHQAWSFTIQDAIDAGQFALYRQPIVAVDQVVDKRCDADPAHYEILVRMVNAKGDMISPNRFIPAAERYHLMPMVDRWVVDQSIRRLESLLDHSAPHRTLPVHAINLSGDSLNDDQCCEELVRRIDGCRLPPRQLCFEVTETSAIANLRQASEFMRALKQMGCLFSLDDFGSGMSSFGYLSSLPVDFVKIDGRFIQGIETDASKVTIVESIVHVATSLKLKTIAERVEQVSIAHRLKSLGVDYIQGFKVGYPVQWT
ncbi:MAG: EAL domain-containing protein [Pseudomonadota bacterium]